MTKETVLQLKDICKSFFGVQVLYDISLELHKGEVLGLVGENGAGKSTMMNIIGGVLPKDSGEMLLDGKPYDPENPQQATEAGIAFIHQELSLFTNMTIPENVYIDGYPKKGKLGIDKTKMVEDTKMYLEKYHVEVKNVNMKVGELPMGTRQMIEIIKALVKDTRILIFDEPTTSLSNREKALLFNTIEELKNSGYSIVYISHILEDVLAISDRITVLRDGHTVATDETSNWTRESLIKNMVGRDMHQVFPTIEKTIGEKVVYSINHLDCAGFVKDINIEIHEGEILGLFGLMGAGRSETVRAVFGVDPIESGSVTIFGKEYKSPTPSDCISAGMAFVTENRREEGLMMPKPVFDNTAMVVDRELVGKFSVIDKKKEESIALESIEKMGVKTTNPITQPANSLSGGNQQKVVISKWLPMNPKIMIVDEPTRGIDVGAKYEIYKLLLKQSSEGTAILFISSEMEELMGICDRILVMKEGKIVAGLDKPEFSQEALGNLAI